MEDNDSALYTITVLKGMYEVSLTQNYLYCRMLIWEELATYNICTNYHWNISLIRQAGYYEGEEFVPGTKVNLLEAFAKVLREKRYVVRENFTFDPAQQGKAAMALEQLQVEVDNMRSGLTRWCKTHYGEAFVAWMHIKVIRVFVESVLRYGLPVDFTAVLYKVTTGKDVMLVNALDKAFGDDKGKEDDMEDDEEYHDFVLIKFDP